MAASKRSPNEFGKLLAAYLKRAGLAEAAFAKAVGIKPTTLNMMRLQGPRQERVSAASFNDWAKVLGLSVEETRELRLQLALACSAQIVQDAMTEARKPTCGHSTK